MLKPICKCCGRKAMAYVKPFQLLFLWLALGGGPALWAQTDEGEEAWVVAIGAWQGSSSFADSVQKSLRHELAALKSHIMSAEDELYWQQRAYKKAYEVKALELNTAQKALDDALLDSQSRVSRRQQAQKELKRLRKELADLQAEDFQFKAPRQLAIEVEKPAKSFFVGPQTQNLFPQADFWFYADISVLRPGDFYVQIKSFDVWRQQETALYSKAVAEEDYNAIAKEAVDVVRERLLGRPWAALVVENAPKGANYFLDGRRVGDLREFENLRIGGHILEAEAPGYKKETVELNLEPNRRNSLNLAMQTQLENEMRLSSEPEGAKVFLDGEYKGQTPLYVAAAIGQIISLQRENSLPAAFAIKKIENTHILLKDVIAGAQSKVKHERAWFHGSFGAFLVSLAAPIVMYNLQLDQQEKAIILRAAGNTAAAAAADAKARNYNIGALVSLGGSAGFLGFAAYRLYRYVKAADVSVESGYEPAGS